MLWGQRVVVYTDHKNLIQDALRLTSNIVYQWRLLFEEYGPEIIYIKGIHNTVADAISQLDFSLTMHPSLKQTSIIGWYLQNSGMQLKTHMKTATISLQWI